MSSSLFHNRLFRTFCIIACGFVLYSFVLGAPFKTLDDRASISENQYVSNLKYIPQMFQTSFFNDHFYYRPLVTLSYTLERHFFGLNYFFFNIINLLLHLATAVIVFRLIATLFNDEGLGFWVGFLFAIHPVQAEAVANIAGRSILLCAFFELSAFFSFLIFTRRLQKRFLLVALVCFSLALLSKESSAPLPAILAAYMLILNARQKKPLFKNIQRVVPFFLVLAGYFLLRMSLKISSISFVMDVRDYFCGILTFALSVLTYLRIVFFPVDLRFDRIYPVIYDLISFDVLLTIGSFALLVFFLIRSYKRVKPEVLFIISLIFLRLLPLSQVIPIRSQAGYICVPDHFIYVSSVGFFTLIVLCFRYGACWLGEHKQLSLRLARVIAGAWMAFLALTTIEQNIYAVNEIAMYTRAVSFAPHHVRMNIALGLSYALDKDFPDAEKYFRRALIDEPANQRARLGLGTAVFDQGRYWEGLELYDQVGEPNDFQEILEANKNLAYRILIEKYEGMLANNSAPVEKIYYSLGVVYAKKGDFKKAVDYFQKALKVDPAFTNARFNLCNCYKASGQEANAAACFKILEEKNP